MSEEYPPVPWVDDPVALVRPTPDADWPSITCPQCRRTSHNPNDVRERYCGACRQYHDTMGLCLVPDGERVPWWVLMPLRDVILRARQHRLAIRLGRP